MRKFTFILVLMAALLAAGQAGTAEVGTLNTTMSKGTNILKQATLTKPSPTIPGPWKSTPGLLRPTTTEGMPMTIKASMTRPSADYTRALEINPEVCCGLLQPGACLCGKKASMTRPSPTTIGPWKSTPGMLRPITTAEQPMTIKASMTRPSPDLQ